MNIKSITVAFLTLLLLGSAHPDPYPDDYFRSPLGIDLYLAGSFAEMRNNHFHAGLDIKTQGQSGYRVYGAADGWVSRIAVSPSGYGNALYVSHPNGYMTVYAHLKEFRDDIKQYVKDHQYKQQEFAVNIFPNRDQFKVSKGEVVALSGNSGSSGGPHLHFEIRDERTGKPVNPALWGFNITDSTPPRIYRLKAYAIGEQSFLRIRDSKTGGWRRVDAGESVFIDVTRVNGIHQFSRVSRIEASGQIAFGVQTHDYHNGSSNRLGAFEIRLAEDDRTIYQSRMETIGFNESRYINAHVDFAERRSSGRWIQRSFVLPGNKLSIYDSKEQGILTIQDGETRELGYQVTDSFQNLTNLSFTVHGISPAQPVAVAKAKEEGAFSMLHDQTFAWRALDFAVNIPEGSLYANDEFLYETEPRVDSTLFSGTHIVHKPEVPLHTSMTMEIVPEDLPVALREKAMIVSVSPKGNISWAGGSWDRGVVRTKLRSFGRYAVGIDETPPTIRPLNISSGKRMTASSQIRFKIRDNLTGIKSYTGRVNGKWILFAYDSKNSLLTHTFDDQVGSGKHILEMTVTDNKDNTTVLSLPFTR